MVTRLALLCAFFTLSSFAEISCPAKGSMPSCVTWCQECAGTSGQANWASNVISAKLAANQMAIQFLAQAAISTTDQTLLNCSRQVMSDMASFGATLASCQANPDNCATDYAGMFAQATCTAASCLPAAWLSGGVAAAVSFTCGFGQLLAQAITCTFAYKYCQQEMLNAQPIQQGYCCYCDQSVYQHRMWPMPDQLLSGPNPWGSVSSGPEQCAQNNGLKIWDSMYPNQYSYFSNCSYQQNQGGTCWQQGINPPPDGSGNGSGGGGGFCLPHIDPNGAVTNVCVPAY